MTYPIAMIPYANMAPYRLQGPPGGCHFVDYQPRESIAALNRGAVLAACVPVGGLDRVAASTRLVGKYGIAARRRCMSVLLFAKRPLSRIKPHHRLGLTPASASSVRLLALLLGYRMGFEHLPDLEKAPQEPEGILLIGDKALQKAHGPHVETTGKWPCITDLAQEWFSIHNLPFVFARWVIRRDAPKAVQTALESWLETFEEDEAALIERSVPLVSRSLNLKPDVSRDYLHCIRRCLDADDLAGQKRFVADLATHAPYLSRMPHD